MENFLQNLLSRLGGYLFLGVGALTGYGLTKAFAGSTRFWPTWLHVVFVAVVALALLIALVKFANARFTDDDGNPRIKGISDHWLHYLVGVAALAAFMKMDSYAHFCLDNGTDKAVTVVVNKENHTIQPQKHEVFDVPLGAAQLSLDGRDTTVELSDVKGHYVYNINSAYTYILSDISYGKEESAGPSDEAGFEMFSGSFFHAPADYLFDPPNEIYVTESDAGASVKKKVLYRFNDIFKDEPEEATKETAPAE